MGYPAISPTPFWHDLFITTSESSRNTKGAYYLPKDPLS